MMFLSVGFPFPQNRKEKYFAELVESQLKSNLHVTWIEILIVDPMWNLFVAYFQHLNHLKSSTAEISNRFYGQYVQWLFERTAEWWTKVLTGSPKGKIWRDLNVSVFIVSLIIPNTQLKTFSSAKNVFNWKSRKKAFL